MIQKQMRAALSAAAGVIAFDQLTKYLVVERMDLRTVGEVAVMPGVLFRMVWNRGVNFGILSGDSSSTRWILAIGTTLIAVALLWSARKSARTSTAVGLGIAAGGAIGNAIDRVHWGAVADFLNVSCCGIRNPWSFNVADIAIFVGLGVVMWTTRRGEGVKR